jgi:hypothetical protein
MSCAATQTAGRIDELVCDEAGVGDVSRTAGVTDGGSLAFSMLATSGAPVGEQGIGAAVIIDNT